MTPSRSAAGIGPVVGAATLGNLAGGAACSEATAMMGRALLDLDPSGWSRRVRDGGEFLAASLGRMAEEEAVEVGARSALKLVKSNGLGSNNTVCNNTAEHQEQTYGCLN